MIKERRSTSRFDSINLISYFCLDKNNHKSGQGMGRTLNISENGIMLETHVPIDPDGSMSITIALEEELMDIDGKVTFSNKKEDGKYETGVHFNKPDEEKRRFLRHYIALFREQAYETGVKG
jgi:c-di-GMP-binding flagellar brake protein YcgR